MSGQRQIIDARSTDLPVFADDSGRRARLLRWATRGSVAALLIVVGAVALTLTLHVPLPRLPWSAPEESSRQVADRAPAGVRAAVVGPAAGPARDGTVNTGGDRTTAPTITTITRTQANATARRVPRANRAQTKPAQTKSATTKFPKTKPAKTKPATSNATSRRPATPPGQLKRAQRPATTPVRRSATTSNKAKAPTHPSAARNDVATTKAKAPKRTTE